MFNHGLEHIPIFPTMPTRPGGATGDNIIDALADVTCDLSTVNGTAFISNPSFPLDWAVNRLITLTAGGKTLTGWGKAAGTGETLDTEIFASPTFDATTGWTFIGSCEISGGKFYIWGDGSNGYLTDVNVLTVGALYKNVPVISRNTATSLSILFGTAETLSTGITSAAVYKTAATNRFFKYTQIGAGNVDIDSGSLKKVLTPSATGITIVSTQGGATQNWASDDGIDPDAASFTLTISF
jgi:hypothetical protein